jgi:large subunit ribosomal protein L5
MFLDKIVVNAGVGRASTQPNFEEKVLTQIMKDISAIAGQKPQIRRARKSIAAFKTREGQVVGLRVTLRRQKMVDFFERLVRIVLPRVRDFSGLDPMIVDKGGVLNIGFREQFVFPEINPEEAPFTFPLGVNLVPRAKSRAKALEAYQKFGVPLRAESAAPVKKGRKKNKKK